MKQIAFRLSVAVVLFTASCQKPSRPVKDASADSTTVQFYREDELVDAATKIVGFLRAEAPFHPDVFSDTVTLYIAPEGGGATRKVARELLRDPANWRVGNYTLTPPLKSTKLLTRVGRHLNCRDFPLSTRYPQLARLPHVGTMLEPPGGGSCLQTWNLTLVFGTEASTPKLVAAVYDQWEW